MTALLPLLVLAAALEMGGDAAIRAGLVRGTAPLVAFGAALLVAYGFTVNADRTIDFGRLIGAYVAVLFVVSQLLALVVFGERPSPALLAGGALIVAGGIVVQLGAG
jgi:drug/metabolite transporter superfamily protein YnfA